MSNFVSNLGLKVCTFGLKNFGPCFLSLARGMLFLVSIYLRLRIRLFPRKSVLYVGQLYYYPWYLSRGLRQIGWSADVLNWDPNPSSQIYYHGEDFRFEYDSVDYVYGHLLFYMRSLFRYDIFHFSNAHGLVFGYGLNALFEKTLLINEIEFLKRCGKKIVYSHNACLDGVSQSSFEKWGPESVCSICNWRDNPEVCSDSRNLAWGKFRNSVADYQCTLGGNRVDFNDHPTVHEVPEFYCLNSSFWNTNLDVPQTFRLPKKTENTLWLYHGVGNKAVRTSETGVNIHTSHVYLPIIEKLKEEGLDIEILSPTEISNKDVRFIQAQSDIFLDMLTYGWFGAMAREAMMLGKPVICFLRPEWLESARQEIPEYIDELPIVSATPQTVEAVLRDLIADNAKRTEIGRRSRAFAVKWHSAEAGASRFDRIYLELLEPKR